MSSLGNRKSYRVTDADFNGQYCMSLPDLRFNEKRKRKAFSFRLRNLLSHSRRQLSTSGHIYRQIEWKVFVFTLTLPDGAKQKIVGQSDETIGDLTIPLIASFNINQPSLRWSKNDALIDLNSKAYHLEDTEIQLTNAVINKTSGKDTRFGILEEIYFTEIDYHRNLSSLSKVYVEPLRSSNYLSDGDIKILFNWIEPLLSLSQQLQSEAKLTLSEWPKDNVIKVKLFSNQLWSELNKYLESFQLILSYFEAKCEELDLITVCRSLKGPVLHSIDHLFYLPLNRLTDYDKYLNQLVATSYPDNMEEGICQWREQSNRIVKKSYAFLLRQKMAKCNNNNLNLTNNNNHINNNNINLNNNNINININININGLGGLKTVDNINNNNNNVNNNVLSTKKIKKGRRKRINWPFKKTPNSDSLDGLTNPISLVPNFNDSSSSFSSTSSSSSSPDSSYSSASSTSSSSSFSSSSSKICLKKLFGPEMNFLCKDQLTLASPLTNLLRQLYLKGPSTVGIFRKSANTRICRELKIKLEENPNLDLDDYPVTAIASVFKELIRSLPGGLLERKYLDEWMSIISANSETEERRKSDRIKSLLSKLQPAYQILLKHFICVLWHIAQSSKENMMSSTNLAVCIAPSLLAEDSQVSVERYEAISKLVPNLISYLIDHALELFGPTVTKLFAPAHHLSPSPISSKHEIWNVHHRHHNYPHRTESAGDGGGIIIDVVMII